MPRIRSTPGRKPGYCSRKSRKRISVNIGRRSTSALDDPLQIEDGDARWLALPHAHARDHDHARERLERLREIEERRGEREIEQRALRAGAAREEIRLVVGESLAQRIGGLER